jgi:hypothetical protein
MEKTSALTLKSELGITHTLLSFDKKDPFEFDRKHLLNMLSKDELHKIEQYFNKYFNLLMNNSFYIAAKDLLKKFRRELESKYYREVYNCLIQDKYVFLNKKRNRLLRNSFIEMAIHQIFFYSDLSIAMITEEPKNVKDLVIIFESYSRRKTKDKAPRLSTEKVKYKLKVIEIFISHNTYSERRACKDVYDNNDTGYSELTSFVASFRAWYKNSENQKKFSYINQYLEEVKKRNISNQV